MAYVTAQELAQHLNMLLEPSEPEDAALQRAVDAASGAVDEYCGRSFAVAGTAAARRYRTGGMDRATIDDATTVTLVEESSDGQTWTTRASTDWWTEPLNAAALAKPITSVRTSGSFPEWLRVTGTWGWTAVLADVKQATLIKAAKLYRRKDSPEGMEGGDGFGFVRISRYEDGDVQLLLNPLRRGSMIVGLA